MAKNKEEFCMKAKTKSTARRLGGIAVAVALTMSLGATSLVASAENWVTDFDSREEAWNAAEELNKEIAGEGMVLLKNDGTLPVEKGARVSVLGVAQDNIVETSGSVTESLKNAGYKVNPTLENFYANDSSAYMSEAELTAAAENSMDLYSDVAVIVIGRGAAGEARDRQIDTRYDVNGDAFTLEGEVEDEKYLGEDTGWTHENHFKEFDESGKENKESAVEYKHELQLMHSEEELIKLAKEKCDKIVVLYSSANQFEMGNLQDDEDINAILWIGRPGDGGMDAIGEVLNGTINPSGKLVDEWTRDLTNDPTYANIRLTRYSDGDLTENDIFGDKPSQFTYYDYEESIYLGYKYYETYWYEASQPTSQLNPTVSGEAATADEWYAHNVVYPFGYGLSYTDFSFKLEGITDNNGEALGATVATADLSSSAGSPAKIETLTAKVAVTNTGDVAGKEVVQAYVTMPYTSGETEKAYLNLVGFAKTDTLAPGETQVVEVTFNVQDFASYDNTDADEDGHKGYELDAGDYTIHFMTSSSHTNFGEDDYASFEFTLAEDANLDLDDYSGNAIENRFSEENGDYYGLLLSEGSNDKMVELSRSDFDGTQPTSPTYASEETSINSTTTLSKEAISTLNKYRYIDADNFGEEGYFEADDFMTPYDYFLESNPNGIPDTWTQGAGVVGEDGMYDIVLADMAGKAWDSADWDTFLNQMTWEEFAVILNYGYHGTLAIDTIGKLETSDENGPNHMFNNFFWAFEPMIASTWNVELAERQGIMAGNMLLMLDCTGWYGPGANIHRSAFSGRSAEYYSQDSLLSGYIGAAVVSGAQSRGIAVYIKHFGLYDQAPNSATWHGVNASEQVIRETYMPAFRMTMQEGGASATMNEYGRIGAVYAGHNYQLMSGLAREEWGWEGFTVTDMIRNQESADGLIRAGAVLEDGDLANGWGGGWISGTYTLNSYGKTDFTGSRGLSGAWDEESNSVLINGESDDEQWYCARLAVKRYLYELANSAGTYNGITDRDIEETIDATQGTALAETRILADSYYTDHDITTEITAGTLPQGMTLADGVLSGTPVESGTFNVTVSVTADGWIAMTVDLTIEVDSVMSMSSDISAIDTGESVNAYVLLPESITEFSMEIVDGALPEGLSFAADGRITGTATTAGTYSFTVQATAGESVYLFDYTITVTGENVVANNVTKVELVEGDIVVTYTDGTTTTIDLPEAEQAGKTVENVTINEAGDTITVTYTDGTTSTLAISAPAAEESGCGSAVNGLIGFAIAVPVIAVAAVVVNRKRTNK